MRPACTVTTTSRATFPRPSSRVAARIVTGDSEVGTWRVGGRVHAMGIVAAVAASHRAIRLRAGNPAFAGMTTGVERGVRTLAFHLTQIPRQEPDRFRPALATGRRVEQHA